MPNPRPAQRSLPSIDSLRCFCAAAEQLNFRRAAQQVGLTPTAFSERIRNLESELGCSLFLRTTRRIALTAAGIALRPAAEQALAAAEACLGAVHADNVPISLRVGTRFELGLSWLLPATMALERARPQLKLDLYFGSGEDILERLERGLLDAVVTSAPVARNDWHAEVLHPEAYELVGSARLLARAPFRGIEDARQHTLLDIDESLPLARYLLSAVPHLEFAGFRACGAGAALISRVLAGDGIAVLPSYMIRQERKSKKLVRLLPNVRLLTDSFRLLHKKSPRFPDALLEVANWLRARPLC
jgi:DNA-binding transcriptional LysR family regulator